MGAPNGDRRVTLLVKRPETHKQLTKALAHATRNDMELKCVACGKSTRADVLEKESELSVSIEDAAALFDCEVAEFEADLAQEADGIKVLVCANPGCNNRVHFACSGLDEFPGEDEDFCCGRCGDDEYELWVVYAPRADKSMREWEAAGYEVYFLGFLRIPDVGELLPVVSRETLDSLPDLRDDVKKANLQKINPEEFTMKLYCGSVKNGADVAAEAQENFAALIDEPSTRGWVATQFALARLPENRKNRFYQKWFEQEVLAVLRVEEIYGNDYFTKSLEKGWYDGGLNLSDLLLIMFYKEYGFNYEKNDQGRLSFKAPRIDAASFRPTVAVATIIHNINAGFLSLADASIAAEAIAPHLVSLEASKALLQVEEMIEEQQDGPVVDEDEKSMAMKAVESVHHANATREFCSRLHRLNRGHLLSHVDTTTEVAPAEVKMIASDICEVVLRISKLHAKDKECLYEMHIFKSLDKEKGLFFGYRPGYEIVIMTTSMALSRTLRDHSMFNRGHPVEEFDKLPFFNDQQLQERYESGKRIIKVLANEDLPEVLPDDRGQLKDLLAQCGFVKIPNDTAEMKKKLKDASKLTFYHLRYGVAGSSGYSWFPDAYRPKTLTQIKVEWLLDLAANDNVPDFHRYDCTGDNAADQVQLLGLARGLKTEGMMRTMKQINETCSGETREAHNVEAVLPVVEVLDQSSEVKVIPGHDPTEGKWHQRVGVGPYTAPYCTSLVGTSGNTNLRITSLIDSDKKVNVPDHAYAGHIALVRADVAARVLGERYRKQFFVVLEPTRESWGGNAMPMETYIPVDDARRFLDGGTFETLDEAYYIKHNAADPKNRYKIEAVRAGFCTEEDLPKRIKELTIKWGRWWAENKNVLAPRPPQWLQCDRCDKWRKVPYYVDVKSLPEKWYCENNQWDPARQTCAAPEES